MEKGAKSSYHLTAEVILTHSKINVSNLYLKGRMAPHISEPLVSSADEADC